MILARAVKAFLAGILTVAFLSFPPTALTPPVHAEMKHGEGTASQGCLAGCASNSGPGIYVDVSNRQHPGENQDKDTEPEQEPYFTQFLKFYAPQKLAARYTYGASVLRPPDLVLLYAAFRN
jgi:hypothetical protein